MKCQSKISRFCEKNIKGKQRYYNQLIVCRYCYWKLKQNGKRT